MPVVIKFRGESYPSRVIETLPSRIKIGDYLVGKRETYKVVTVQPGCPYWETRHRTFTNILVESEDGEKIPLPRLEPDTKLEAYRPVRRIK